MKPRSILLALPLLFAAAPGLLLAEDAPAKPTVDVLELEDGRRLEGHVVGEDAEFVTFAADGVTRAYSRKMVSSLTKGVASATPTPPADGDGKAPATEGSKAKKKADRKAAKRAGRDAAPLAGDALAWLHELMARAGTADPQVRRSIAAAMSSLGPGALEPLRQEIATAVGTRKKTLQSVVRGLEGRMKRAAKDRKSKGDRPAAKRRGGFDRLAAELELSDEQKAPMGAILKEAYAAKGQIAKGLRAEGADLDAAAAAMEKLRADVIARAKPILDEGQFFLFEEMTDRMLRIPYKGKAKGDKKGKKKPAQ